MTPLTEISIKARQAIRYGVYLILLFFIVRFSVKTAISIYRKIFPPAPPPPTVAFGKLPKLPFPIRPELEGAFFNYKLETPTGDLPKLAGQLPVFGMPSINPKIMAYNEAKNKAEDLGFLAEGQSITGNIPNVYIFRKKGAPSLLTINIVLGTFSISYDLAANPSILSKKPQSEEVAKQKIIGYLESAQLLPSDMSQLNAKTKLLKVEGGTLKEAISLSEANFIRVDLFRNEINFQGDKYSSITPDYQESNVWFITNDSDILIGEYHYFPTDLTKSATYPIKPSHKLWQELTEGKAFIVNLGLNSGGEIIIRRIYLAYYDPGQYVPYYQPVAVFEGDNNFVAILPSITDEYYLDKAN